MSNNQILLIVLATMIVFGPSLAETQAQTAQKQPNLVFLLTDDQATITMECYGNQSVKTPNLSALANQGVVFDRHYVSTAICMASRANIFTGLYEFRTGCNFTTGNLSDALWSQSYPMRFRAAGYLPQIQRPV